MSLTFAIADLHGRYDLLLQAYRGIASRASHGTIIHLGDYIDRGPKSRSIIEFLMNTATRPAGFERVILPGNHDELMIGAVLSGEDVDLWLMNGGDATLHSYGSRRFDPRAVPTEHIEWLLKLEKLHFDRHRVYVHAAVDPDTPLSAQSNHTTRWHRYSTEEEGGHGDLHVVHGHHPYPKGPLLKRGRTDLDTLAWKTGRLVVGVFDDNKPGGPVDLIEVVGRPHGEGDD